MNRIDELTLKWGDKELTQSESDELITLLMAENVALELRLQAEKEIAKGD